MQETALYRKYRPQKFSEVFGQDHIVKVLESSIEAENIAHSYIFSGTRGTGKTSVARIFAREIGTGPADIIEIDAASNNGVEEIRAINDSIAILPFESKYKVYILDEAHMLSKGAWNAFLKTLEEPPKHVIFILATTEFEKIPETIISRCQTFSFRKPSQKILKDTIIAIAKKEKFSLEQSSADLIAFLAEGSFRDAQSILQKVISASKDKKISAEEVEMVTGSPKSELVNDFLRSIDKANLELGLSAIGKAVKQNIDILLYFKLALHKFRAVLLLRNLKSSEEGIMDEFSEEDFKFLKEIAGNLNGKVNSKTLLELLKNYDLISKAYIPELALEAVLEQLLAVSY